jgi:hypothetical protein
MGSAAKIVLVGAVSLVVGIYSVSLKRVQTSDLMTSISATSRVQTESIEDMALRAAVYRVQANRDADMSYVYTIGATKTLIGGGTYTYDFPSIAINEVLNIQGTVTVTPPNEATKTIDVTVSKVAAGDPAFPGTKPGHRHFVRGRWQITKAFVRPVR